jgi:hypothetical protein
MIFYRQYTVIIFLARNGRTRAVKFRPNNFGRISFDLGEISPNRQILRLSNGRNSPKLGEIRQKFLRANLNCADSPISNKFRPKKKLLCMKFPIDRIPSCPILKSWDLGRIVAVGQNRLKIANLVFFYFHYEISER